MCRACRGEEQRVVACYDKAGRRAAEVINRAAPCRRAVFGRVTPTGAHRSDPSRRDPSPTASASENSRQPRKSIRAPRSRFSWLGRDSEARAAPECLGQGLATHTGVSGRVSGEQHHGEPSRQTSEPARGAARLRDAEEIAEQVRTQTPPGDQEAVDEEPGGEKVAELDLLAVGHAGHRDRLSVVVYAVAGREKHRHLHHLRGRELGGLRLDLLLLRRVRGEPEEREHRERDDHVTRTSAVRKSPRRGLCHGDAESEGIGHLRRSATRPGIEQEQREPPRRLLLP